MLTNKRRGFTLIELLVVIAIIAILAAILFPVFTAVKRNAQLTHCLNNMRSWAQANTVYMAEYHDTFPYAGATGAQYALGTVDGGSDTFYHALAKYTANAEKIRWCPAFLAKWGKTSQMNFGWSYWYFANAAPGGVNPYVNACPKSALCGPLGKTYRSGDVQMTKKPLLSEIWNVHALGATSNSTKSVFSTTIVYCDTHARLWQFGVYKEQCEHVYVGRDGSVPVIPSSWYQ